MKTNKAVKGRFKITATGKLKRSKAGKRHLLTGKSSKRKRHLRKGAYVYEAFADTYKKMLGQ